MYVFHHNDLDGRGAAAVVYRWWILHWRDTNGKITFKEIDYAMSPDFSKVEFGEQVVIVDFSFKPAVMDQLLKRTRDVIWIDHHETAKDYSYDKMIKGLRDFVSKSRSGCELAWDYYFPDDLPPVTIKLIGDYDKFSLKYTHSKEFYEGLKTRDNGPQAEIWNTLLSTNDVEAVTDITKAGMLCIKYRDSYCAERMKASGYDVIFEGLKCRALNVYGFGSDAFKSVKGYDVFIAYISDGIKYTVSLYTDKPGINCGTICKKYGGGGHEQSAGFICTELPFKKGG